VYRNRYSLGPGGAQKRSIARYVNEADQPISSNPFNASAPATIRTGPLGRMSPNPVDVKVSTEKYKQLANDEFALPLSSPRDVRSF
jgi:hypothetical protein